MNDIKKLRKELRKVRKEIEDTEDEMSFHEYALHCLEDKRDELLAEIEKLKKKK